ncbi:calcium-binding protein [Campylobacter geochelonis]|uniref:calcium-binding protein n=1 Tax=Campylobacter geochelonis TaxID=1780362 RepID=UPI00155DBDDB|nr:calcium-binding protein [Campylobacter geochelonis]QKF71150.1 calcium-binding protein, RTX toxin-related [Campylobacter geochelonis]
MSNFSRLDYIKDKVQKYSANIAGIVNNYNDPVGLAKELTDLFKNAIEDTIDKNVKDASEADKQFANMQKKRVGIYIDGKFTIIDLTVSQILFNSFLVDTSGSSIDDGNDKLYLHIEKSEILYAIKRTVGNAIDILISRTWVGAIVAAIVDIPNLITSNHTITVEYRDKNSNDIKERKYILYNATDFDTSLSSEWRNISSDMNTLDRVIFTRNDTPVEFIYHKRYKNKKDGQLNTFEFRQGRDEKKIVSVLKRIGYPINNNKIAHMTFSKGEEPKQLIANYYANYGAGASSVMSDLDNSDKALQQAAAYALENLKGYALAGDISKKEYINIENYSDNHLNDRANFLKLRVQELTGSAGIYRNTHYYDTKENISAGDKNTIYNEKVDKVVFITGDYTDSRSLFGKKRFYGYSDDNTIISSDDIGVYIESGLGCDTITTGDGNDIIYTNAKIDDGNDKEDSNTTNTVNSGKGNDKIYGSKGVDNITVDDGVNVIYSKDSDDSVNTTKGKNTIYLGAGSDSVNTNGGTNTIYTGLDNTSQEDKDSKDDINTINLTNGNNTVYGSKAQDIVTSNEAKSDIFTKDGDDKVSISGAELNNVFTGSGNDTIAINGGKGHIVYTHKDSIDGLDLDTKDSTNTVEINLGKNTIYGGKGKESLTIKDGDNTAYLYNYLKSA